VIETSESVNAASRLRDEWAVLPARERVSRFHRLTRAHRDRFFVALDPIEQVGLLHELPRGDWRQWLRLLGSDDAADLVQHAPEADRRPLLELLDEDIRAEVRVLLPYAEDEAAGLMNPRFVRVRSDMSIDDAIRSLRNQAPNIECIYYAYVLDAEQRLQGVLSLRHLLGAVNGRTVRDLMRTDLVTVQEELDQEVVARIWREHDFLALPVVDSTGHMKGIITYDDIATVLREEATEDIQKAAGMAALEMRYLATPLPELIRKRGGWLGLLFIGEMLTASAMAHFQADIAAAVVLALFVPLIIGSGGNSGSQASTLVIRSMALGELRLSDWWRVLRREALVGVALGLLLAALGLMRIVVWQAAGGMYGEHYLLLGTTVALSLVGVVMWGSLTGALLPFALRRAGLDPASASAPLVATIVDVTGLVIYFTIAGVVLRGTLLP
jgi:magnesium transporter